VSQGSGQAAAARAGALISFVAPLAAYLLTLAPGLYWRDAPEMAMVPFLLDIAHPPGVPAYALLGKLMALLPLGSVALRANLLSALLGACAALALYGATRRAVLLIVPARDGEPWHGVLAASVATAAALLFAFAAANWYWAVVAEVYTTLSAVLAAVLYAVVRGLEAGDARRARAFACLAALGAGLGAGVHPDLIVFLPAVAAFLLIAGRDGPRRGEVPVWPVFLALGLSVYLYLPVRSSTGLVYDYGNPETLRALVDHVTARSYAERVYHYPWARLLLHWRRVPWMIAGELGFPALVLGAVGLAVVAARRALLAALIALLVLANLWLVKDWTAAFGYLPTFLAFALLAGVGAAEVAVRGVRALARPSAPLPARGLAVVFVLLACGAALAQAYRGGPVADKHGHRLAERHGKAVLDGLPEGAVLVSSEDSLSYPLHYLQYVENYRTDVAHVHRAFLPYPDALAERWPELGLSPGTDAGPAGGPLVPLLAVRDRHPLFLDRSERTANYLPTGRLAPYGVIYRVLDAEAGSIPGDLLLAHARVWSVYFDPLLTDPWFAPADWTAREVYSAAQNGLGDYFFRMGYPNLAESAFREARTLCPECPQAYANLGTLYLAQDKPDAARDAFARGLAVSPDEPGLVAGLAEWADRSGDGDAALSGYRRALSLDPARDRTRVALAQLCLRLGRDAEADSAYRRLWAESGSRAARVEAGLYLAAMRIQARDRKGAERLLDALQEFAADDPGVRRLEAALGGGPPRPPGR
jgi:Flp pilus assembly protein TadD